MLLMTSRLSKRLHITQIAKNMSLVISRLSRQFRYTFTNLSDVTLQNRVCFHCSSYHRNKSKPPDDVVSPSSMPKFIEKEEMISKAMKSYLMKKQESDNFIQKNIDEYDLGRRHLANIMGLDEADMSRSDIKRAIAYLLPSGLHNKKARPMMEHPLDILPNIKAANFDKSGRPNHYLYYTLMPNFYAVMHDLALKLEVLRKNSENIGLSKMEDFLKDKQLPLFDTTWIPFSQFQQMFEGEKVTEHDYRRLLLLLERIIEQPLSFREKNLIFKYRIPIQSTSLIENPVEPAVDEEGRQFVKAKGGRKTAKAEVVLRSKGSGKITINGQDITYFDDLMHRQAILWPLQLSGVMGKYDVEATVDGAGPSAEAGAIRLGIARALVSYVNKETAEMLRIAGLLTRDPRMKERKKPGQEKARKKFTWKRR